MPRPPLPSDDLYARLGVPVDASVEAIEIAWRGLLRRHHPDVAGDEGLEAAKRINVAHDWLADPSLRARYDRERGLRHAVGPRGDGRGGPWHARGPAREASDEPAGPRRPAGRRRPADPASAIARFLERLASLTPTDIDRLALAEPPPIAFGATIRRFLPPVQRAALDELESRVGAAVPAAADRPAIRDAIDGYATELVLGPFLDELLSEPFRSRARERLTRGWEAAVDRPRYGPNGAGVEGTVASNRGARRGGGQAARRHRCRARGGAVAGRPDTRGRRWAARLVGPGRPRRRGGDPGGRGRPRTGQGTPRGSAPRASARAPPRVHAGVVRAAHGTLVSVAAPARRSATARPASAYEFLSVIRSMMSATSSPRSMVSSRTL